ncbi:putative membrane-associated kinase regulator 1, partial [Cucurbita argyrosperma subsp. sororia]
MKMIEKPRDPIIKSTATGISPSPKNSFSSSSSSDFEFTVSISPRKSSTALCPADELFCNGHLLPLHSRRNSLVPTLLPSSSTSSSADSTTTTSRDSTGSSSTDHSRSSSQNDPNRPTSDDADLKLRTRQRHDKKCKQFSFARFSSVFRKEPKNNTGSSSTHGGESRPPRVKGIGSTAKEVIKKCFRKVQLKIGSKSCHSATAAAHTAESAKDSSLNPGKTEESGRFSLSFSGNLRYPRGRSSFLPSCPSSTRSSPSHSGVLRRGGVQSLSSVSGYGSSYSADMSSMEELHSAIQGAIAHCKNSLIQTKDTINPDEPSSC